MRRHVRRKGAGLHLVALVVVLDVREGEVGTEKVIAVRGAI